MTTEYTTEQLLEVNQAMVTQNLKHLDTQFEKGRITGTEYAQVYASIINTTMQLSMQFLLSRDSAARQYDNTNEDLIMKQERHGINRSPI